MIAFIFYFFKHRDLLYVSCVVPSIPFPENVVPRITCTAL